MRCQLAFVLGFVLLSSHARADDAIPPETVTAVKHATVFVRVQGPTWKGSGSGFVILAEKGTALIATNHHVISSPENDKKPRLAPAEFVKSLKVPTVTAVFDSGTKTELSARAEVIAADPETDLAILRVTGLKEPPAPIAYATPPKLAETMAVFTFGYPLGEILSTGKGAPAITVGKGAVSSLRNDDEGELKLVQIDASLNPGNSGGPVVDAKGRLIGVVVSGYSGRQGLNFAIPAAELGKMMKGRLDGVQLTVTKGADGKFTVRAEVGVVDPASAVRGATLHYLIVLPKGTKPKPGEPLEKQVGAKKFALKIEAGIATGEIALDGKDAPEGHILVEVVPDGGAGASGSIRARSYALVLPKAANEHVVLGSTGGPQGPGAGETAAPAGWKEYTATNKTYMVWVPEKGKISETQRLMGKAPGPRMRFNAVAVEMPGGATCTVEQIIVTPPNLKLNRDDMMQILREVAVGDGPGAKVTRETDTKMGRFAGKEYLIERGAGATRARAFVIGNAMYLLRAIGTGDQVEGEDSTTFLDSCRLQGLTPPAAPSAPSTAIAGGAAQDPEFKDAVPEKGALVGMEFALDKMGPNTVVRAVRGIFRAGDMETFGPWRGTSGPDTEKDAVKVVAKPGYAVGAITAKTGPAVYGLSVTFMKLTNSKLDPKDSYESDWVGGKDGPGAAQTTVGGKAEPTPGLAGKTNARGLSGVGLAYAEVAKPNPNPGPNPGPGQQAGRGPRIQGGGEFEYHDVTPPNGVLVGVEVGLGKWANFDVIKAVRPIYRVGDKDSFGEQYGTEPTTKLKAVAKPGYAVGAMRVRSGGGIDAISFTFMKLTDGKLDPKDSYESEWLGGAGGYAPVLLGGDGTPVVGMLLRGNDKEVSGVGLIYSDTNKPGLDGAWPKGAPSKIQGGGGDPEFRETGPEGSLLVGLEVGVGRFFNNPVIKSVRSVFRVGEKDTVGEWHGPTGADVVKETVKVLAKPGYAVGRITLRTGLGMDGLSVTFMKVTDGKLDPTDSYESEWVGGKGGGEGKLGDGKQPVIGLIGKARADTVSGLGLLFPPAKK